ncbi:hypothetical protein ACQ4PT_060737 [Festuca glaucescens]
MLPLVRVGRAPLRRLGRLLLASPQTLSLCSPNTTTGCGGGISPLVLMLSARPSACWGGDGSPAARAQSGASSRGFCVRAVSVDDEAPSSSAAAAGGVYDLSAPYLSVRIRCRKEDADLQATNIIINPGLAFGTGEHPTTKLCLLFLKEVIKGGERVLDYGTGTGVLSIAALKMGAALSTGIDIDPQAVASAHENKLLNGMDSNKMLVYLVPAGAEPSSFSSSIDKSEERKPSSDPELKSSSGTFDIVAANILLNPLLELVEDIVRYAKTGGTVAVSGILCEQVPKVEKAYSRYLDNVSVSEMDGWACLQGTRKA